MLPITRATLQSFCRTCLREFEKPTKKQETYNIETTDNLSKWLISTCSAPLLVTDDAYPSCLCQGCYSKVRTFFEFRDKSLCSVEALKELLAEGMEETTRKNLQMFCRTCLKKLKSTKRLVNVAEAKDVANWMLDCTGIEMNTNETMEFPRYLCSWCYKKLRNFVEFRKISKQSFEYLESVVGRNLTLNHKENSEIESKIMPISPTPCQTAQRKQSSLLNYAVEIKAEPITVHSNSNPQTQEIIFADKLPILKEYMSNTDDNDCGEKGYPPLNRNITDESAETTTGLRTRKKNTTFYNGAKDSEDETTKISKTELYSEEDGSEFAASFNENSSDSQKISKKRTKRKAVKLSRQRMKCNQCERKFVKRFLYEAHVQAEHKGLEKPFKCSICSNSFRMFSYLRRHMSEIHSVDPPEHLSSKKIKLKKYCDLKFECTLCSRKFKRKEHLKDHHKTVHLNIRPFKCYSCEKTFATRKTCRVHEMGHTGERPFGCEQCDKTFRQRSELKIHLDIHTENKELFCTICRRVKGSAEELKAHIEEHIASQQHQCPKCGRIFKKISHLNEHDRAVHLKLRPFKCSYCEKSFALAKTCRTHERTHTGERPEACSQCDQKFKQKSVLFNHMKRYHTQENDTCH